MWKQNFLIVTKVEKPDQKMMGVSGREVPELSVHFTSRYRIDSHGLESWVMEEKREGQGKTDRTSKGCGKVRCSGQEPLYSSDSRKAVLLLVKGNQTLFTGLVYGPLIPWRIHSSNMN